jgi:L-iditol 2-dehydrogenase
MKAAVFLEPKRIEIQEIADPRPGPGEVLLRVDAATICGTDLKIYQHGKSNVRPPQVLGHEFAGTIAELGDGVEGWAIGETVAVDPVIACGVCRYCLRGKPSLCGKLSVIAYDYPGAFAPFIVVPRAAVQSGAMYRVPVGLSPRIAAIMEPLACAVNAHDRMQTGVGDTVLVTGAGPLGVMHACLARARGARTVLMADVLPSRLALADGFGLDGLLDASAPDFIDQVKAHTDGEGADVVVVANSAAAAQQQSLLLAAKGARICFFGGLPQAAPMVEIDSNVLHYREQTLFGAFGASRLHNAIALELLATGQVPGDRIVTHTVPLAEIVDGLGLVQRGESLKVAVETAS